MRAKLAWLPARRPPTSTPSMSDGHQQRSMLSGLPIRVAATTTSGWPTTQPADQARKDAGWPPRRPGLAGADSPRSARSAPPDGWHRDPPGLLLHPGAKSPASVFAGFSLASFRPRETIGIRPCGLGIAGLHRLICRRFPQWICGVRCGPRSRRTRRRLSRAISAEISAV